MKRPVFLVILAATLLSSALYVAAAPPDGASDRSCNEPCDGPDAGTDQRESRFLQRMTKILDLTEAQQVSIKKVQAAEQEKTSALRDKMRENRQQLRQLEAVTPLDENALRALAEEGGRIETELTIARARSHSRIDVILTPEQRQVAAKLRPNAEGKRRGGRRE